MGGLLVQGAKVGHGWLAGRSLGSCGMICSTVTSLAPWRMDVPRQSDPVSPPPMITTCLPSAVMSLTGLTP